MKFTGQKNDRGLADAEYKILKKFLKPNKIDKEDSIFLIEELAEVGLMRLGTDFKNCRGTAQTTELGRRVIEDKLPSY